METLPQIIKELRALGLTQKQIGEGTGFSQAHVSNVEKGKRGQRTPADTLQRAQDFLDRKREELKH